MNTRRNILIIVLALVAAMSWWLQREPDQRPRLLPTAGLEGPDFYMQDFRVQVTGPDGRLRYELAGDEAAHMQDDGHGELISPLLLVHQGKQPPIRVASDSGWIAPAGDEILLLGRVTIERPAGHVDGVLNVVTSDLRVWPDDRRARTDAHVVATGPAYTVEGVGMQMDMIKRTVVLESQVEGTSAP